jgi:hypothetical protein
MAPGSYDMVFRDVRAASLPQGLRTFREEFHWLFNSYYNSLNQEIPDKSLRSAFSRPSLDEILAFRAHIDQEMDRFLANGADEEATRRTVLGLNHEQQHQELALTDIKHALLSNPLHPSYMAAPLSEEKDPPVSKLAWTALTADW